VYACPGGHELKPFRNGKLREMTKIDLQQSGGVPRLSTALALHGRQFPSCLAPGAYQIRPQRHLVPTRGPQTSGFRVRTGKTYQPAAGPTVG
jgi:hypothetical protein